MLDNYDGGGYHDAGRQHDVNLGWKIIKLV